MNIFQITILIFRTGEIEGFSRYRTSCVRSVSFGYEISDPLWFTLSSTYFNKGSDYSSHHVSEESVCLDSEYYIVSFTVRVTHHVRMCGTIC